MLIIYFILFKKVYLNFCSFCLRSVEKILVYFYILFAYKIITFIINYIERLNLSFKWYPMQTLCLLCSLIKITHDSFVFIIWRTVEDFSNIHSKAFVIIFCYHFPHSFLSLCFHSKYIFFVSKPSVNYANFSWIWLDVVVKDHLVFTFEKLVHTCVTLCHTEFTLERRMGDILKQRRYQMQVDQ